MLFNRLGLFLLLLIEHLHTKSIYENQRRIRRQIHFENLGEECRSNDECRRTPVDGTKICLENHCQCAEGYVPIDSYRCIRDFIEAQIPPNPLTSPSIEIEESPGYGSSCTTNEDCQHLTIQLECYRSICVCLEGYVPLGKYLCYNIRGQGPPIIESSTSTSTLSTTTTTTTTIIQSFVQTCLTNDQCQQIMSHSHCFNSRCQCLQGYIPLDDHTCIENDRILLSNDQSTHQLTTLPTHYRSLLGGHCLTNENCQTVEARCVNQICTCPMDSFPIDEWNCLKDVDSTSTLSYWWPWSTFPTSSSSSSSISPRSPHFSCLFNDQCLHLDVNSHCKSGRCICNDGYEFDLTLAIPRCIQSINNDEPCD